MREFGFVVEYFGFSLYDNSYLNYLLFRCLALGSARHRSRLRTSRLKVSDRRTCFGIAWFKKYINIFFNKG